MLIGLVGVLVFGKRLPEVGRNLGRSIVEFKKGIAGIDDQVEQAARAPRSLPPADAEK